MNRNDFGELLREWKELLSEGEASVGRIMKMIKGIEAISREMGKKCKIRYVLGREYGRIEYDIEGDVISGAIDFERLSRGGKLGDFIIFETFPITSGYGPLLYEILIEKASEVGVCLMSDREKVSDSARAVWDKYLSRDDIKHKNIDDNEEKNIDKGNSLAKCYRKPGELVILNKLRDSDFIDFIEVGDNI